MHTHTHTHTHTDTQGRAGGDTGPKEHACTHTRTHTHTDTQGRAGGDTGLQVCTHTHTHTQTRPTHCLEALLSQQGECEHTHTPPLPRRRSSHTRGPCSHGAALGWVEAVGEGGMQTRPPSPAGCSEHDLMVDESSPPSHHSISVNTDLKCR